MNSAARDAARREREREHGALMQDAGSEVAAMSRLVRARESRGSGGGPLEIEFASARADGSDPGPLPASVWVALRRGDIDATLDALIAVSEQRFVLGAREELGDGYRLRTVEEVRMLPDLAVLREQLAAMLDIPADVVAILGEWGPDDPRTAGEIDVLLDSRFGPIARAAAPLPASSPAAAPTPGPVASHPAAAPMPAAPQLPTTRPSTDAARPHPAPPDPIRTASHDDGRTPLRMSVAELADVLQLSAAQGRVLSTLVRHATLTVADSADDH